LAEAAHYSGHNYTATCWEASIRYKRNTAMLHNVR